MTDRKDAWVYVIGPEVGPQKIGISEKPTKRLSGIQTGHPFTLRIALQLDPEELTALAVERRAHAILRARRLAGEWFDVTAQVAIAAVHQAKADLRNPTARPRERDMEPRVGVLVRFPLDVLAALDQQARGTGQSRNAIIVERCRGSTRPVISPRSRTSVAQPKRVRADAPERSALAVTLGPAPVAPGSRLKKR